MPSRFSIYGADKPIIYPSTSGRSGSRTLLDLISGVYSGQTQPLARWKLGLGNIIPMVNWWCVWIWVGHPDDGSNGDSTGGGDECAGGVVHLASRSLAEGGDSEICSDSDRVVMARSLSTSASGGR
ncbi:hypothetical protein Tco_0804355, partial [Tanacetum coccineum]